MRGATRMDSAPPADTGSRGRRQTASEPASGPPPPTGPGARVAAWGAVALMAIGSISVWLVSPVAWLWIGSQLAQQQPSMGPYLLVIAGVIVTTVLLALALSRLNRLHARLTGRDPNVREQLPWLRSLRGERAQPARGGVLEVVMVISVTLALVAMAIWFFALAHPGAPQA